MGPRWWRRSAGTVEHAGDVVGVGDDLEDAHAPAALAADGDVDGENSREEARPREAAWPRRHVGRLCGCVVRGAGEAKRELEHGRWDGGGRP